MRKVELLPTWDCEAGYGPKIFTIRSKKIIHIKGKFEKYDLSSLF